MDPLDIMNRLRNLRTVENVVSQKEEPEPVAPKGMELRHTRDALQDRIDEFLSSVPDLGPISPKYRDLPDVTEGLLPVSTDFPDGFGLEKPALLMQRVSSEEAAELGRNVIPMLASGFSQQGAGALFLLAFQLRSTSALKDFILDEADDLLQPGDIPIEELSKQIMMQGVAHAKLPATDNVEREAAAYAYIAASTLRLFTKSEENYTRAFNHITNGYFRFYGHKIPINAPAPTVEALKTLTHFFSHGDIFRWTLYRILYIGGGNTSDLGLRTFLYEMHLANTGMHIVGIFVKLCVSLQCTPGVLMQAIESPENARQIDALVSMLALISDEDPGHSRKMWRYGRVFNEAFMSPLHTKACPSLVYILASALKGESAKSNQDILNIAQLAEVGPEKRRRCAAAGEMIVRMIRKSHVKGGASAALQTFRPHARRPKGKQSLSLMVGKEPRERRQP